MRRNAKAIKRIIFILGSIIAIVVLIVTMATNSDKRKHAQITQTPIQSVMPTVSPSITPTISPSATPDTGLPTPTNTPEQTQLPGNISVIRTDYDVFKPNEIGDIPIVMFHRFIEEYEPNTEKDYTTTFKEFETLLQTLYDQGFRLISMQDFIDCNISVPAGTIPMVFTFDDGTAGQFNLIKEGDSLKVNPDSAVGIMMAFNDKHPDFGLKGIFYVNMDLGNNTFMGERTLKEKFEELGFKIEKQTWGHNDYKKITTSDKIVESLGKNQEKAEEILPGLRFYSLALPYGSRPKQEILWNYLREGTYDGINYLHETIMAVGANPSVPSISKDYNSLYVRRIRAQGRIAVDADLTWWLPKMTSQRMFISDGDSKTIVIPESKIDRIDKQKLGNKELKFY